MSGILSTIVVLLVLTCHVTTFGLQQRRFLLSVDNVVRVNLTQSGGLNVNVGGFKQLLCGHCQNGYCSLNIMNGKVDPVCNCAHGWTGKNCDIPRGQPVLNGPGEGYIQCGSLWCKHGFCLSTGYGMDTCHCHTGWTGHACDFSTATTTITKPTTTQPPTQAIIPECKHTGVLGVVAYQRAVTNSHATICSATGLHDSHEALIIEECNVRPDPLTWKPGKNVLAACNGSGSVPAYSPIAVFDDKNFSPNSSLSGVFLSCTSTGFKFVVQQCGQSPEVMEVSTGGTNLSDPSRYYTVS